MRAEAVQDRLVEAWEERCRVERCHLVEEEMQRMLLAAAARSIVHTVVVAAPATL